MRSRCPELHNRVVSGRPNDPGVEFGSRGADEPADGVGVPVAVGVSAEVPQCG